MTKGLKLFSRTIGIWLLVVFWWASWLVDPFQVHTSLVVNVLPWMGFGSFTFIFLSFFDRPRFNPKRNSIWLIPVFMLILTAILIHPNLHIQILIFGLILVIVGCLLDFKALSKSGLTIFAGIAGLVIASIFLSSVRGYPYFVASFFGHQVSFLLNLFSYNSAINQGALFFNGEKITFDPVKSGVYLVIGFYLCFVGLVLTSKASTKSRLWALGIGAIAHYAYLLLRLIWVAVTHYHYSNVYAGLIPFNLTFWKWTLLTFCLLIPIWWLILRMLKLEEGVEIKLLPPSLKRRGWCFAGLFLLTALLIGASFSFYGLTKKQDRVILFDEIHSRWESTLIDYDRQIEGPFAENSYHSFLDYISRFYPTYVVTDEEIKAPIDRVKTLHARSLTMDLLTRFEKSVTLVLKCVTIPFSHEEIDTLVEFVRQGGSLFLIGDHTDVFFMNQYMNRLSMKFGIEFEANAVYMIDGGWIVTDKNDFFNHPITQFLDIFIWATGASIKLKPPAYPVITSPVASFADNGSYFNEYFFGNRMIDAYESYGSYAVVGVSEFGKGRVVAFTDSTCFNNYLFYTPGRRELLKGVFQWLETRGSFNLFLALGLIGLVISCMGLFKWKLDNHVLAYLLVSLLPFGLTCGYLLGKWVNTICYPEPKPVIEPIPKEVILDAFHESTHCICYGNSEDFMSQTSYENFLFALGRVDLHSRINYRSPISKELLKNAGVLILISPTKGFSKRELIAIADFVKQGRSLLLIEGPNTQTTINQVASLFKLKFRREPFPYLHVYNSKLVTPTYVEGGKPLFLFEDIPVISYTKYGKGLVLAIGDDNLFTRVGSEVNMPYLLQIECDLMVNLWQVDEKGLNLINWASLAYTEVVAEEKYEYQSHEHVHEDQGEK